MRTTNVLTSIYFMVSGLHTTKPVPVIPNITTGGNTATRLNTPVIKATTMPLSEVTASTSDTASRSNTLTNIQSDSTSATIGNMVVIVTGLVVGVLALSLAALICKELRNMNEGKLSPLLEQVKEYNNTFSACLSDPLNLSTPRATVLFKEEAANGDDPNTTELSPLYQNLNPNTIQPDANYQSLNPNTTQPDAVYQSLNPNTTQPDAVYQNMNPKTIQLDAVYQSQNPTTTQPDADCQSLNTNITKPD
ncbi:uncharacterized protein LOC143099181 [Alosa pseudoharengus]|uniref:uncharacterized protein LOC143099181 n=1 Tax=Alosa pseudoharengus TaxID=34774 RepID=UPI003F88FFDF